MALAQARGELAKPVPEVLFLCVANTGRSQMAAALLAHRAAGRVHVRSAGSLPGHDVEPPAVEAMREVGIDIAEAYPKPLTDDVLRAADVIITMGCGDACPVLPGKRYLDWPIADPAGATLSAVRAIRDDIDARVQLLITELTTEGTTR
nr:arsenate reductase ArsC [Catenuloplanes japonicus]